MDDGVFIDTRKSRDTTLLEALERYELVVKGIGPGTLYLIAKNQGWRPDDYSPRNRLTPATRMATVPARQPVPGMNPADVWGRCEAATNNHPYILQKGAAGGVIATSCPTRLHASFSTSKKMGKLNSRSVSSAKVNKLLYRGKPSKGAIPSGR